MLQLLAIGGSKHSVMYLFKASISAVTLVIPEGYRELIETLQYYKKVRKYLFLQKVITEQIQIIIYIKNKRKVTVDFLTSDVSCRSEALFLYHRYQGDGVKDIHV